MKKIIILGDSGHAKVIADIVDMNDEMKMFAMLDDKYPEVFMDKGILKGPIIHVRNLLSEDPELGVVIGIGSNLVRKSIVSKLKIMQENYISLVHPTATISPSAEIGRGTVVMPGAIINASASIGAHVIINSGSVVEHDTIIENYAHISPLAVITGGVIVGEGVHIGASASVIPTKKVGDWSIVGAGAVVVDDINEKTTVVGAPAREIKKEGL